MPDAHDAPPEDPEFGRPILINTLTAAQLVAWVVIGAILLCLAYAAWSSASDRPGASPAPLLGGAVLGLAGLLLVVLGIVKLIAGAERKIFYERGVRVIRGNSIRAVAYRDVRARGFIFRASEHVLELYPLDGSPVIRAGVTNTSGQAKRQQFEQLKAAVAATCAGPYGR